MSHDFLSRQPVLWALVAWTTLVNSGWSGCKCNSAGPATAVAGPMADPGYSYPSEGIGGMTMNGPGLSTYPSYAGPNPGMPMAPAMPQGNVAAVPGTNRYGLTPPPGTLSQTYQRRTTLIPDDKHPRYAAVDVSLPEKVDVTARGLKSIWTGEVWKLETEEPLLPGRPHIYAIRADWRDAEGKITKTEVRWVRLIMGRVVELDF
ncbi:hypothetical protein GC163_23500 [bacterium]|nr:hypothetical protein [bacterium]